MEKNKKQKNKSKQKPDYTPDCLESNGSFDQIRDSISMEYGRDRAREIMNDFR